jgi:hypothetical protein
MGSQYGTRIHGSNMPALSRPYHHQSDARRIQRTCPDPSTTYNKGSGTRSSSHSAHSPASNGYTYHMIRLLSSILLK